MTIRHYALSVLLVAASAQAQQLAQYSQYVFNHFSINPAVAGSKDCLDVRMGYRQQWVGFEGAPNTGWASLHGALGSKKNKGLQKGKHGIGAFIEADNAGNWGYTRFLLAYAYHLRMTQESHLAFGVFAGAQQMKLNVGEVTLTDFNDPAITGQASTLVWPDVTPGVWYYHKKWWAGASIHHILGRPINDIGLDSRMARHIMLSGGYQYRIGRKTTFTPSTLLKFASGVPLALDLNTMVEWNRVLGVGVGYRNGDALVAMMKVGFLKYFQVGYSYDLTTSKLRVAGNNTHEIILGITPCSKDDLSKRMINCPAFD
jgi:type IX secretion system PorP/SprF family membrane protein